MRVPTATTSYCFQSFKLLWSAPAFVCYSLFAIPCRCSVILSPLKCPVILSPCRNGEDNHVGTTRAEANVGTEPGPEWEVGGARSRRDFRAESAADPSITPGLPETRGQSPGPWESGAAAQAPSPGADST